jgi:tetratricopeptide (TPR) repeat protein
MKKTCSPALKLIQIALLVNSYCLPALALAESEKSWEKLMNEGTTALDANEYWKAEPLLKRALNKANGIGRDPMDLARSLHELGRLYAVRGRFSEAEPYFEEELSIKEKVLGEGCGLLIPSMGSLVKFYLLHGTASKAPPLSDTLLDWVEGKMREPLNQASGKVTLKKGQPLQGFAGTAAPVMRDPLLEWAITCDDLGNVYKARKEYDTADRYFKAALDMKSTVLGKQHLSLANSYDSLGEICMEKNEYKDAESYFRDAFDLTYGILEPNSWQVYARLDKLARCLTKAGKIEEAKQLYLKAENLWKNEPSKEGNSARALYALGNIYAEQKDFNSAESTLRRALTMSESFNGPCSVSLVPYLQRYAYVLYYLGRRGESDQYKARANTISGG